MKMLIKMALLSGKDLDFIANKMGLKRHKVFFFLNESDESLRKRMVCRVRCICDKTVVPIRGCKLQELK